MPHETHEPGFVVTDGTRTVAVPRAIEAQGPAAIAEHIRQAGGAPAPASTTAKERKS